MKFCKRYEEYMQGRERALPAVGIKKLKKLLKRCRREFQSHRQIQSHLLAQHQETEDDGGGDGLVISDNKCPDQCQVCYGTFFPSLLEEMAAVVCCFNERAQKLLEMHLASGFRKCILWFGSEFQWGDESLIEQGKELVTYAIINSIAMRKILKKYDKIHYSRQGQAFRSQAQSMHIEILQSPWLCELMAFYINLRQEGKVYKKDAPELFGDCSLSFSDGKPTLTCALFDSVKLDRNLTCSICLDTVFDAVSLTCGHIFCYMCCCSAASVTIFDRLQAADLKAKCPLCRREGVCKGAVHLEELNILLSRSCPEYWEERLQSERVERVQQAKEHWESQCRAIVGL